MLDRAERLHHEAFVCDLHVDTLQRVAKGESLASLGGSVDIPRMKAGGVDFQLFAAWIDPVYMGRKAGDPDRSFARACELLDAFDREMMAESRDVAPACTAKEAREIVDSGRIAAALSVEGGHAIENDLGKLDELYHRGVRSMGLTWNNTLDWADAAKDETLQGTRHGGLTDFGEKVVHRMHQHGMIVDLSHAAETTFWHVLRISEPPVMASHSDAHALSPHYRNLKDDQIRALAKHGGLVGINFYSVFLDPEFARRQEQAEQKHKDELEALRWRYAFDYPTGTAIERRLLRDEMGHVPVAMSRIVDHIEYIAQLVGPDHVALGSDFDGTTAFPDEMQDVSCLPLVTQKLLERGWSETDVRKVLGENVLRLFEAVCG